MIDFYGLTSPNVQKIFIMLEETGLPYNFKAVDVWASAPALGGIRQAQPEQENSGDRRHRRPRAASPTRCSSPARS
jgi:glutathione S-transferase